MSGKKPAQQPQPPKLPKQSPPSNTSQAKNHGQIVLVSLVSLVNRYVVSTIPKPNYERPLLTQSSFSSALVYIVDDPFGPLQSQRSSQPSNGNNKSPYIKKLYIQHIFYIKPHMIHIKDPLALAMEVLLSNWHFFPKVQKNPSVL